MQNRTKVAVVGLGYLGKRHANIYHHMPHVDLIAVVDINPAVAQTVSKQYQCAGLTTIYDLPSDLDAVSIVVPTNHHLPVSRFFFERGIHTMLEKPIALSEQEGQLIVEKADKIGVILQIGHVERFNAGIIKLAELANDPKFIEIHRLNKFVERGTDVDVVMDLMIHDIDIVFFLINSSLKKISASGIRVVTNYIDIATARLEFENKAVANVTASRVSRNQFRRIRVFSNPNYFGLNFVDQQLETVFPIKIGKYDKFSKLISKKIKISHKLPLNAELEHFVECVQNRRNPIVNGHDGLKSVVVAEKIKQKIFESM